MKHVLRQVRDLYEAFDMFYWKTFFRLKDLLNELEEGVSDHEDNNTDSRSVKRSEVGLPTVPKAGSGFIRRVDRK